RPTHRPKSCHRRSVCFRRSSAATDSGLPDEPCAPSRLARENRHAVAGQSVFAISSKYASAEAELAQDLSHVGTPIEPQPMGFFRPAIMMIPRAAKGGHLPGENHLCRVFFRLHENGPILSGELADVGLLNDLPG